MDNLNINFTNQPYDLKMVININLILLNENIKNIILIYYQPYRRE